MRAVDNCPATYNPGQTDTDGDGVGDACDATSGIPTVDKEGVTATSTASNQPPTADADAFTAATNSSLTVPAPGVLSNDSDPDGDTLSATLVTKPAHGVLTLRADGSFDYTPTSGYQGSDSFTYTAVDARGLSSKPAAVTLTVAPQAAAQRLLFLAEGKQRTSLGGDVTSGAYTISRAGRLVTAVTGTGTVQSRQGPTQLTLDVHLSGVGYTATVTAVRGATSTKWKGTGLVLTNGKLTVGGFGKRPDRFGFVISTK